MEIIIGGLLVFSGIILFQFYKAKKGIESYRSNTTRTSWARSEKIIRNSFKMVRGEKTGDVLERILNLGLQYLNMDHALVSVCIDNNAFILETSSKRITRAKEFESGQYIKSSDIFSTLDRQQTLAIDYAGSSDWKNHACFFDRGWESYLASTIKISESVFLTVAFLNSSPREDLFSLTEKEVLHEISHALKPWVEERIHLGESDQSESKSDWQTSAISS
ncbi:MAG: hypothetical protein M9962_12650 [Oligoflexia bacterium]|nr:hypothetical protein [Oligoflexia bacterium]